MRSLDTPITKEELIKRGINLYLDESNLDDLVEFDSMINIRPSQNNRSRNVEDSAIQEKIKTVVSKWLK